MKGNLGLLVALAALAGAGNGCKPAQSRDEEAIAKLPFRPLSPEQGEEFRRMMDELESLDLSETMMIATVVVKKGPKGTYCEVHKKVHDDKDDTKSIEITAVGCGHAAVHAMEIAADRVFEKAVKEALNSGNVAIVENLFGGMGDGRMSLDEMFADLERSRANH